MSSEEMTSESPWAGEKGLQFAKLWTRAQPRVALFIRSLVPDSHDAEDILQETAMACMRKMDVYDPERDFTAWARGFARIQALRYRQRGKGRYSLLDHPDVVEAIDEVHDRVSDEFESRSQALGRCLGKLAGKARHLLELRYSEDLSFQQVAERISLGTDSVKVMLFLPSPARHGCVEESGGDTGEDGPGGTHEGQIQGDGRDEQWTECCLDRRQDDRGSADH